MSDPVTITSTDLILKGRIAAVPITVRGMVENGKFAGLSGCVTIKKRLEALITDLGAGFDKPAEILDQLTGGQFGKITLDGLAFGYHGPDPKFTQIVVTMTAGGNTFRFVMLKVAGNGGFVVGLDLLWNPSFFENNILSGLVGEISIGDLGMYYASQSLQNVRYDPGRDFQDSEAFSPNIPKVEGRDFTAGLNWSAQLFVGGVNLLDWSGLNAGAQADAEEPLRLPDREAAGKPQEPQLPKGSTFWIELNKSFGPLSVKRIGLSYDAPRAAIKFDAGLQLSCLTLSLLGLGVSYPVNDFTTDFDEIRKNLKFNLDGAAVALDVGPITIGGGLLKVSDVPLRLDGTLIVRVETFAISAIGSYANLGGIHSLFVFAALQQPLGGPPYFFVTGMAFGFGLNRALVIPTISDVHNFPLVKAATDPDYLAKNLDLRAVSRKLSDYIYPSPGDFWMAAGLKFTTFGLLDSFALLSVSLGTQFEIALLGLAKMRIPKQLPGVAELRVIAYVELALKIAFAPEHGYLAAEARLTENSYILTKDFKLRGGFAFYLWFAGAHAGDFVISIGGYHPRFRIPDHYPRPDLVEFSYRVGGVMIKGYCYFTLCPCAIMAGGGLSIVYQSGGIKAWFLAYADFLIQWKPLYYDIAIGISVGVALNLKIGIVRIKLSLELGASVDLYGPPLGGKARISLWIITFTVKFGRDRHLPPPLLWESADSEKSFAKSFLPNPSVTRISIADGLLKEVKDRDTVARFVSPHKLALSCTTLVPATAARFNDREFTRDSGDESQRVPRPSINGRPAELGVRPMGKSSFGSLFEIILEPTEGASEEARQYLSQYIKVSLTTQSVPLALWGAEALNTKAPPQEQTIDDVLTGLEIRTQPGPRPWETPALELKALAYEPHQKPFSSQTAEPRQALPGFGRKTISNTIEKAGVAKKRTNLVKFLAQTGRRIMNPEEIQLSQLKENAEYIFQDMPAMARMGQYPPRGYLDT
jgi:hypothetical protein